MTDRAGRLASLAGERAEIAATVRRRILQRYTWRSDASLDRLIREVATAMMSGLSSEQPAGSRGRVDAQWRDVAAAVTSASTPQKHRMLAGMIDRFVDEIAAGFDTRLYRAVTAILGPALAVAFRPHGQGVIPRGRAADRFEVAGPLDHLRRLADTGTLVIAPTHSSNLDSIALGMALPRAQLPACAYAAAKYTFRNRLLGRFARNLGAYCLHRGLPIRLYNEVLREYCTVLLERGFHSVIFPGATRCRSNEVDTPLKLGLLRTALRAERTSLRRIHLVPATINYQVILEADFLIRYHLEGRSEERIVGDELFKWGRLRQTARRLWALDQIAVVRFGEPIDVRGDGASSTRQLTTALTRAYQRETVFLSTHVASRAIYDLALARTGSSDIRQLVARDPRELAFSAHAVNEAIGRIRDILRSAAEQGSLHHSCDRAHPEQILGAALAAWRACHLAPPVIRADGEIAVASTSLLYFYRNRTNHVAVCGNG